MLTPSFRSLRRVSALSLSVVILSGCGGPGEGGGSKLVSGDGFVLSVPASWDVKRAPRMLTATGPDPQLVAARVFPLVRRYRPALDARASRELDRVAAQLARGLGGSVASTRQLGGKQRLTRWYEIRYRDLVEEITFVLLDRHEFQLTCRRKADADRAVCKELLSSFRPT